MLNQFLLYKSHKTESLLHQHHCHHNAQAVVLSHTLEVAPSVLHIARPVIPARKLVIMPECAVENSHDATTPHYYQISVH